jgi:DNA invertase Pin-like site-specific DNA recombinase|tara:strand:+ start:1088 stop:1993 length:906 start_codon:yes stop_codon:yes gene_type:complete
MRKIGYARVSTSEQSTEAQVQRLKEFGCDIVFQEKMSGGNADRPMLEKAIRSLQPEDKLVVIKFDRLARSLPDLINIVKRIEDTGAFFESVSDTIDCSTPLGRFFLHILGSVAEFERSLVHDRTVAGLKSAREHGRVGGNPRLRARDPEALAQLSDARDAAYFKKLSAVAEHWVPIVSRYRPDTPWEDVLRIVNVSLRRAGHKLWTDKKLRRAAKRFVAEGMLSPDVLSRSKSVTMNDSALMVIAGIINQAPHLRLDQIAHELKEVKCPTPRGRPEWSTSSVLNYVRKARAQGLINKDYAN